MLDKIVSALKWLWEGLYEGLVRHGYYMTGLSSHYTTTEHRETDNK